ncbi:hypothetical protein B0H17DRAFT_896105, partial [Mycena rosella]
RLAMFDDPKPSSITTRMYEDLSRPQSNILAQVRTAHIRLNTFLYSFHLAPSPDCNQCLVFETVSHFLLACWRFHLQ